MEDTQTHYVADATVPPAESHDSSKNSTASTGPLWALAGMMTGKPAPIVSLSDLLYRRCTKVALVVVK
mgnify:CR=1 FL=1